MPDPMTVVLVDDHSIVREGLKRVIEETGEFVVVGQASDGADGIEVVCRLAPDLVLLDLIMPGMDGVTACREMMARVPGVRVVVLTASRERDAVLDSLAAGATGYLRKDTDRERLLSTFRSVAAGDLRVPADAVSDLFAELRRDARRRDPVARAGLTQREREILAAFVQGNTYAEIAAERGVKPVTVRNAVYSIQGKVGVDSMPLLVVWAVQNGVAGD